MYTLVLKHLKISADMDGDLSFFADIYCIIIIIVLYTVSIFFQVRIAEK